MVTPHPTLLWGSNLTRRINPHTLLCLPPHPSSLGVSLQRHCRLRHQDPSTTNKSVQVRLGLWRVAGGDRFSSPACHFPSRPEAPGQQVSVVVISRTAVFLGPRSVQHKQQDWEAWGGKGRSLSSVRTEDEEQHWEHMRGEK